MVLKASFPFGSEGNTVPYPPLFDDIRRNQGFIDLRGMPARVVEIGETRISPALCSLLENLAQPGSRVISLGCDLGRHLEKKRPLKWRRVAGGYVQVACARLAESDVPQLRSLARGIESVLRKDAGNDYWETRFELRPVHFKFEQLVEAYSIWIWFFAAASSIERAAQARERLLISLSRGLEASSTCLHPDAKD